MYFAVTVFHKKGKNKVRLVENTKMKALILKEIQKLNLTKTKKSVNRHAEISTFPSQKLTLYACQIFVKEKIKEHFQMLVTLLMPV